MSPSTRTCPLRNFFRHLAAAACISVASASQPYSEASADQSDVIIQDQLDGAFKDQASLHHHLRVFGGGAGKFQFGDSGLPVFGQGLQGYAAGEESNGSNYEVPEAAPSEFTIEVVVTILPGFQAAAQYGIAGRDELKGAARYFQFYKGTNNQLAAIVFDSAFAPHMFSAANTPDIVEGHTYLFALACKKSQVSLYATDLTQDDPVSRLKMIDGDTLDAPLNTAPGIAPLIIGDKSAEYSSQAVPMQFDMVRYSSVARSADDFQIGLNLKAR